MSDFSDDEHSHKRRRTTADESDKRDLPLSLTATVSPPPLRRRKEAVEPKTDPDLDCEGQPSEDSPQAKQANHPYTIKSPFQLTWVRDLPESSNVDAVTLKDILGDPLISECWEFNYMHNVDFLMGHFDTDVRNLVKVHVVHGFWRDEDISKHNIKEQASRYPNVKVHTAYMPEMFGTHHSKMIILLRHDSTAQVIIHTANMIEFDWTNMTQAVWRSPLLPLLSPSAPTPSSATTGSGVRFKIDLLNYLKSYDTKRIVCKPLITALTNYDFSSIKAALIASVPSRLSLSLPSETSWGWPSLQKALSTISCSSTTPEIITQCSSIATLGLTSSWLEKTFFGALSTSHNSSKTKAKHKIVFPTADEIRRSLNGYASGSAVHMKTQTPAQQKQLQYMKPYFHHWTGDGAQHYSDADTFRSVRDAGRKRAAPHIKTYTRFSGATHKAIDWMLVTSANLSKQAWGDTANSAGEVRVCSYEIGVLVWPALWGEDAVMVPAFKSDTPDPNDMMKVDEDDDRGDIEGEKKAGKSRVVVGARMPYDLPLVKYRGDDEPWCATKSYTEPDWTGRSYMV